MMTAAIAPVFVHASNKRRKNVWYTVKAGVWTDPTIWQSNASSPTATFIPNQYPSQIFSTTVAPVFPQVGDDVYISHVLTLTASNAGNYAYNLYISASGSLTCSGVNSTLIIGGDLQCIGSIVLTNNFQLRLAGFNNYINTFSASGTSQVAYIGRGDQQILDLSYVNLALQGGGNKFLVNNLTLAGGLTMSGATFVQGSFSLYVALVTGFGSLCVYSISAGATSVFNGALNVSTGSQNGWFQGSGSPTLEFRAGIIMNSAVDFGTATVNFTTNNQTLTGGSQTYGGVVTIVGNITLTNLATASSINGGCIMGNVYGTTASSTFTNQGYLILTTNTLPMSTLGIFKYNDDPNSSIGFLADGSYTLPYTTYASLFVGGIGTKTFSGNATIAKGLYVNNGTSSSLGNILDCGSNDVIAGTGRSNAFGYTTKSGTGTLIFTGLYTSSGGGSMNLTGVCTAEFRGGISSANGYTIAGTAATILFTTNNQPIIGSVTIQGAITISGAITLTATPLQVNSIFITTGNIDSNNPAGKLMVDVGGTYGMQKNVSVMPSGLFDSSLGTTKYNLNSAQPVRGGTYAGLELGGSGVKTLQGNVTVPALTYVVSGSATLNLNGFTLTLT